MMPAQHIAEVAARFHREGALTQAEPLYREALRQRPDEPDLWAGLGAVCHGLGRRDEAVVCYEFAHRLRPEDPIPLNQIGIVLSERGELAEAVAHFERALVLGPELAAVANNLGLALLKLGRAEEARLRFEHALGARPDLAEIHNNLGLALQQEGRVEEACRCFAEAAGLRPDWADPYNNLGVALAVLGRPDDALACYDQALRCNPEHVGALTNLGTAYQEQGRSAEAIASFRQALALRPEDARVHSNLLLALHYRPVNDLKETHDEACAYAARHTGAFAACAPHRVRARHGRRLRVGYVSADFREHPVVRFLEPVLAAHDRRQFEIACYSDVSRPDAVTRRLQGSTDHWRSLVGRSDADAAAVIRGDDIDILVDLAGHTAGNRLLAFARRPAPVQVSYLGYLGTTGLPAMDYYLTDAHADPPGEADASYRERLVRLPGFSLCYDPGPAPEVDCAPPARQTGRVTFASLNNPAKVSDQALSLWSRVLAAVPDSLLLLRTGTGRGADDRFRNALARGGIAPDRLLLAGRTAGRADYLALHGRVDIGLDPFPYNGLTTTCDALWMGVPVVSLAGRLGASRQGVRVLRAAGLDELLVETPEDYVRTAAELACDLGRLAALRSTLRERMLHSPLMDAPRLTHDIETAYRCLWDEWAGRGENGPA